ncbi:MAG: hypothetical protein EB078_07030 [Proteobacteria bacterium]|nr:hypothetical protein [Pseudomonadota bacterium]NDC22897.1 hypothetical protein [Pseudomonadota bacterium]NDD04642.1 hypothetical protein [Pseudomonadota bacterium]NDG26114.1 hypothetical protein [Pseudomonadota bacterium]
MKSRLLSFVLCFIAIPVHAVTLPNLKLGPSFSVLDYKQSGTSTTAQIWTSLRTEASYNVSPSWAIQGKGNIGLFPVSKGSSLFNLRYLELGLGASYMGGTKEGEGFFPSAGYQYQTFLNGDNFGFRNVHGPCGLLSLRLQVVPKRFLQVDMGVGLMNTDVSFSGTNNELSMRASYIWEEFHEKIPVLTLQGEIKRYSLEFIAGEVGAYFYSLTLLASF